MNIKAGFSNPSQIPQSAIGFTAIHQGSPQETAKSQAALQRALGYFDDLVQRTFDIGQTHLVLWGRGDLDKCCHILPDSSILFLIGSPSGIFTWETISKRILKASSASPFILPWEGRVIFLKIDPTGNTWTLWNDWLGSIPVFHAETHSGRIASTLEPAVVDALEMGESSFFFPGMLGLLIWGHYFSDWTLFKDMKVAPPDCEAIWDETGFHFNRLNSVKPSDERWLTGLDDLIDEMYQLSKVAIENSLKEKDHWILPLSSGLDSRLIAGVAAELGTDVHAYTWGRLKTSDVIHAKNIAQTLEIPWKYLNPGDQYLTSYRDHWADLFGSAMHFHGMYQMPFLDALKSESSGPILSGFIGECLAGYDIKFLCEIHSGSLSFQILPDGYLHWTVEELQSLMKVPIEDLLGELANEVHRLRSSISGALFQQLRFLILWGRQRYFTYFQSAMSDYWRGVSTPYLDRNYARFSFSLPRAVLDNRMLQQMLLKRYYPKLASIPGTYAHEPAMLTGSYLLKKRLAKNLPGSVSKSVFPGLYRSNPNIDVSCVARDGKKSFYPIFEKLNSLSKWVDTNLINETYHKIIAENDGNAVRKLQSVQTLAYRLSD